VITGDPVVVIEHAVRKLDDVALRLPPLDTALDFGALVDAARGRADADRPSLAKGFTEERRRDHRDVLQHASHRRSRVHPGGVTPREVA
jgi:hypothetical protein